MTFLSTTKGRLLLAIVYLVSVNLLSGFLAEALDYPSLWGRSGSVWGEYAIPLPFTWALAHLVSMLPMALLIAGLPLWPKIWVIRARWILIAALIVLFFAEVKLPYGRLRHVPFYLFLAVDAAVALLLSLLIYPPIRTLIVTAAMVATMTLGIYVTHRETTSTATENALEKHEGEVTFFEEISEYPRGTSKEIVATVRETVGPDIGPNAEKICAEAKALLAKGSTAEVKLMVHPWFETEQKYVYSAGSARYDTAGEWLCDFSYPTPAP